jgi:LysR family transcriptional activator of nhaA
MRKNSCITDSFFWNNGGMDARTLNYKHLHYFWMVCRCGGVAKAGERLHVTPQSISGQIRMLEEAVGEALWRRAGRRLELTEIGHLVLEHAERMFNVGEELKDALRDRRGAGRATLRVGVAGSVVKALVYRMLAPALAAPDAPRLDCREGRFQDLLALLAVHQIDLVLSDRPLTGAMHVRGFNHLLTEGGVSFLGVGSLAEPLRAGFPASLDGAPVLLPGRDAALRPRLMAWFDQIRVRPRVVGEFDDTAVMKAFGQAGAGIFPMPALIADEISLQYHVDLVGRTDEVAQQLYAVSVERRLTHPAVVAISEAARAQQALQNRSNSPR